MGENSYAPRKLESSVPRVRPRQRWLEGVNEAVRARGHDTEQANLCKGDSELETDE